jgi:hypothetical protein
MADHRVRQHTWIGGILNTVDHFFEDVAEAIGFAKSQDAHTVKVYDANGQLVHHEPPKAPETYA